MSELSFRINTLNALEVKNIPTNALPMLGSSGSSGNSGGPFSNMWYNYDISMDFDLIIASVLLPALDDVNPFSGDSGGGKGDSGGGGEGEKNSDTRIPLYPHVFNPVSNINKTSDDASDNTNTNNNTGTGTGTETGTGTGTANKENDTKPLTNITSTTSQPQLYGPRKVLSGKITITTSIVNLSKVLHNNTSNTTNNTNTPLPTGTLNKYVNFSSLAVKFDSPTFKSNKLIQTRVNDIINKLKLHLMSIMKEFDTFYRSFDNNSNSAT